MATVSTGFRRSGSTSSAKIRCTRAKGWRLTVPFRGIYVGYTRVCLNWIVHFCAWETHPHWVPTLKIFCCLWVLESHVGHLGLLLR